MHARLTHTTLMLVLRLSSLARLDLTSGQDYLKNDGCTGGKQLPGPGNASATLYARMRDAIAETGRSIFLNIKQDIHPGGFGAACALANSFRISDDIKPCQGESGLITDIAADALQFAGPGCFLDLDSLEVGVDHGCPNEQGSTSSSELTRKNWMAQLSLWVRPFWHANSCSHHAFQLLRVSIPTRFV